LHIGASVRQTNGAQVVVVVSQFRCALQWPANWSVSPVQLWGEQIVPGG